ncbi:squalene/phytoene synthase family protein [Jhaorihella thermophila]|uniref:Phytoene/squalene synthetase n=1 Tax=Jhaorihella thermophila TaxID=488547 RepID=A0A1H5RXS2_9RHOB|nr:squalene/phytoene synthase family protein [Jhaorihella thermophila]SEF43153.1 Phytoene/squalene synthetase [Jhaorihella thermophila]
MVFDGDLAACADLVRRGDPDRFLAAMAAPVAARAVLFPLYAFNVEISRAPWASAEPMIAEMRLQWWRDMLEAVAAGRPAERHEVVAPLARVLDPGLAGALDDAVVARRWDIYGDRFAEAEELERHIDRTAGTLMWVAARALGPAEESVVRDFAIASGLANWLRAVPAYRARGRDPLPPGADAAGDLARRGLERLARARRARGAVSRAARPALLAGWQAGPVLAQAARDPDRAEAGTLGQSEAGRRLSLMLRAATGRW